ncbi:hypothetical protein [Phenylobacterium sp.]|nr:hypothetical protein [Phenylobacterium sp.]
MAVVDPPLVLAFGSFGDPIDSMPSTLTSSPLSALGNGDPQGIR